MKKLLGRAWRRFIRLIAVPNSHRVYGPNVMYPIPVRRHPSLPLRRHPVLRTPGSVT